MYASSNSLVSSGVGYWVLTNPKGTKAINFHPGATSVWHIAMPAICLPSPVDVVILTGLGRVVVGPRIILTSVGNRVQPNGSQRSPPARPCWWRPFANFLLLQSQRISSLRDVLLLHDRRPETLLLGHEERSPGQRISRSSQLKLGLKAVCCC